MSTTETVLTFVVAPAAIILVIAGLALAGGARRAKRYRPGRPYDFTPVWFLAAPEQLRSDGARALPTGDSRRELTAGEGSQETGSQETGSQETGSQGVATPLGATGGASDRW